MKWRQNLIRWMPLGGSLALMGNAIFTQNWVQTLLTFPWLAGSTAWAAYSESFLERLDELLREKGSQGAESTVAAVEKFFRSAQETLWRDQLSEFETRYLTAQATACRDYRVEGNSASTFVPMLSEVFVPLELSDVAVRGQKGQLWPVFRGLKPQQEQMDQLVAREGLRIWDLLKEVNTIPAYRQIVIKSWGGYGKTTLLRHLAFVYGNQTQKDYDAPAMIPFLIYLRDLQRLPGAIEELKALQLPQFLTQKHIPNLPAEGKKLQPPKDWANQLLGKTRRRALVMLDGFDEVKEVNRNQVSQWIADQMREYPQAVFILTSRPNAYNEVYNNEFIGVQPTTGLFVSPFNRAQQERFLRQWYFCQESYARGGRKGAEVEKVVQQSVQMLLEQLDGRPELQDLAKNPLLLNLIGTFHRFYPGQELPQRRGDLYEEICKLQLGARPLARRVEMPLRWEESREVLQGVALAMVEQELRTMQEKPLLELFEQMLRRLEVDSEVDLGIDSAPVVTVEPAEFLRKIVQVSELLVEREAQEYEFAHISFQNYLAALEVKYTKQEKLMLQNYDKPAWKELILLFATQMRNPAQLIRKLCEIGDNTSDKAAVELAYTIWQESTRKFGSDIEQELGQLVKQLQIFRFRDLETFLKNEEWKKADNETYRLMINTVRKEEGQSFTQEELLNFPSEDLLTIDRLWREHSNDRYGFSIQWAIYNECLTGLGRAYPSDEVWKKFAKCVGWRVKGSWFKQLQWDGTGVKGHLPFKFSWYAGFGARGWSFRHWKREQIVLFQRLWACQSG